MRHDFTPRRVGEILDDSIALVRVNFRTIGAVTAVVLLPVAAAYSVVASFYIRTIFEMIGQDVGSAVSGTSAVPDWSILVIATLMQALGLLYMGSRALLDATVFSNSDKLLERRPVPLKDALRTGFRSFVMLVVVQMITAAASGAVAFAVGLVFGIASFAVMLASPGIGAFGIFGAYLLALVAWAVASILLAIAGPAVVIEGGLGQALMRSLRLVRRHFWRVLLIVLASALLVAQFESALATPTIVREIVAGLQTPGAVFGEIAWGWKVFDGLVQGLAISLVIPFSASVTLLTYLDLRARDEGMDLVIRARELLAA